MKVLVAALYVACAHGMVIAPGSASPFAARHVSVAQSPRTHAMAVSMETAKKPTVPTLNKADLVSRIATRTGVTKKVANDVLVATVETIIEAVCEGNKVMLVGFGSFAPKSLPAREGRNPRTGEKLQIQASRVPAFSVAKTFKERVNNSK